MKNEVNQKYAEYEKLLSKERIDVYLNICNNNKIEAFRKYKLNSELSAILYEILAHLEILLRNAIVQKWNDYFTHEAQVALKNRTTTIVPQISWPLDTSEIQKYAHKHMVDLKYHDRDISTATDKFNNYKSKKGTPSRKMTNGDLISQLNFGFWYDSLRDPFNTINRKKLYEIFPHAPHNSDHLKSLKEIRKKVYKAYQLRNRIAHHEPIINSANLLTDFDASIEIINYLSKDYKDMLLRKKTGRFIALYKKI